MRILFVSQNPLSVELGAAKVLVELSEEMVTLGWRCAFLDPNSLKMSPPGNSADRIRFASELGIHLERHAPDFDIVDYDHLYLPFPRSRFAPRTLFVARSALLPREMDEIKAPVPWTLRSAIGNLLHGRQRRREWRETIRMSTTTLEQADLINVNNDRDKDELVRRGIDPAKIVVVELGLSRRRRVLFNAVSDAVPDRPVVAFVGTFDWRKGAADFPKLVDGVLRAVPGVRFRLLGTAGLFPTAKDVLRQFPSQVRPLLEVVPRFAADELPSLLAGCSVGVFPSYLEGFGLGVLEMLAAAIPVIAYDVPGPPMMLPQKWLTPPGDVCGLVAKVIALLHDRHALARDRVHARGMSRRFDWTEIAQRTADIYGARLAIQRQVLSTAGGLTGRG